MPRRDPEPTHQAQPPARRATDLGLGLALTLLAGLVLGYGLSDEPSFVDESAYYSQSYFAGLFIQGRHDDPLWLEYQAYDLPPLPKYLIGSALAVGGVRTPGPAEARAWYSNTSLRFDPPGALTVARIPSVMVGALGCGAVYGLGFLLNGRATGVLASLLMMTNPLYRLLARRAMSDVPCEAFLLLGLLAMLRVWDRLARGRFGLPSVVLTMLGGLCLGLSLSSKFSGLLGMIVLGAWLGIAVVSRFSAKGVVGFANAIVGVGLIAATVFVGLNPFLTTSPKGTLPPALRAIAKLSTWERVVMMYRLRLEVSEGQQSLFGHNALTTASEKIATTAVQGFGRFGPFGPSRSDSTARFDPSQDWGGYVWLPWVALGACWAGGLGLAQRRAGLPTTSWALLTQFLVTLGVVTAYVPMAWDRYFLAIQAPSALLASGLVVAIAGRIGRRFPRVGKDR